MRKGTWKHVLFSLPRKGRSNEKLNSTCTLNTNNTEFKISLYGWIILSMYEYCLIKSYKQDCKNHISFIDRSANEPEARHNSFELNCIYNYI